MSLPAPNDEILESTIKRIRDIEYMLKQLDKEPDDEEAASLFKGENAFPYAESDKSVEIIEKTPVPEPDEKELR
jgi:hypothetical protein